MYRYSLQALFLLITAIAAYLGGWVARDRLFSKEKLELKSLQEWRDRHEKLVDLNYKLGESAWNLIILSKVKSLAPEIAIFEKDFPISKMEFYSQGNDIANSSLLHRKWVLSSNIDKCHRLVLIIDGVFEDVGPVLYPVSVSKIHYELRRIRSLGQDGESIEIIESFTPADWEHLRMKGLSNLFDLIENDCE